MAATIADCPSCELPTQYARWMPGVSSKATAVRLGGNHEAAPLENGEVEANATFLVYRSHLQTDHQLLSGCREDVLRKVKGAWKVARRTIVLDANVLLDKNLSSSSSVKTQSAPPGFDRSRALVAADDSPGSAPRPSASMGGKLARSGGDSHSSDPR
jgi:hypothetical protein